MIQGFNAFHIKKPEKWWHLFDKIIEKRSYITDYEHYILAISVEDAIEKYKMRYDWCDFDGLIDPWWGGIVMRYPKLNKENPEFTYEVCANECYPSFNILKKEMRVDEFLEYCKQEMFPLEVILAN